jgi:peptidoglycan/xylan/chitin deacetylase (PgdA/CDA1 family)
LRIDKTSAKGTKSTILMYHGVVRAPERVYDVSLAAFERQLDDLAEERLCSLDDVIDGAAGVALTFDDGYDNCLTEVAPRLERRGWRAMAYITSGYLGRPGFLEASELRDLLAAGFSIGAHGHTHRSLNLLCDAGLRDELLRSKDTLEQLLSRPVEHMALPNGAGGRRVVKFARRAGFRSIATSWPGVIGLGGDPYALPRFPLRATTSHAEFLAVLACSRSFYYRAQLHVAAARLARGLVGAERYAHLRELRHLLWR